MVFTTGYGAVKVANMKIMDDFCYKWKSSCAYHQIDNFTVSKDELDTKEDPAIKIALHIQQYGKNHLSGCSNIEQQQKLSLYPLRSSCWRH